MAIKGGCLIYFIDADGEIMILTGKESNYLSDLRTAPTTARLPEGWSLKKLVDYKQEISGISETMAKQKFSERAIDLEKRLDLGEIRHDTPEEKPGGVLKVNYRYLLPTCKKGIFKGNCEDGETPLMAAIREVREELGMRIKESKLVELPGDICINCKMFTCEIGSGARGDFEKVISDRHERRYGELFEVAFEPLRDVMGRLREYNSVSSCAIKNFNKEMRDSLSASVKIPSQPITTLPSSSMKQSTPKSPPKSPPSSAKKGGTKRNMSRGRARRHNKSYKRY
jgi:hypothetical protein